ncbi:MAG: trp operon repressor [Legionellales bacterium]|jgi:TrpR family trp operon transcriptional repressor|nr:trp operon repressor [Legionellales bacterium]
MNSDGWRCFLDWCVGTQDKALLTELYDCLLTPEEKDSIETRCLIVRELLSQEQTQRQISESLQVSIAKITRGSNQLKRISPKLKAYLSSAVGES